MRGVGCGRDAEHVVFRATRCARNLHRLKLQSVRRHQVAFPRRRRPVKVGGAVRRHDEEHRRQGIVPIKGGEKFHRHVGIEMLHPHRKNRLKVPQIIHVKAVAVIRLRVERIPNGKIRKSQLAHFDPVPRRQPDVVAGLHLHCPQHVFFGLGQIHDDGVGGQYVRERLKEIAVDGTEI